MKPLHSFVQGFFFGSLPCGDRHNSGGHMTKIVLISDVHFTRPGTDIIGLDPEQRLAMVLDDVRAHHADAEHIFFMGDLAHRGSREEYARLQHRLTDLPAPFTLMPGNHDRRAGFEAVFGHPFGPSVHDTPTHRIVCMDTLDEDAPDIHSGYVSDTQLAWALEQITTTDLRSIVLTHHPLGAVGFDGMDGIALRNGAAVAQALRSTAQVDLVISGHVHRMISGSLQGLPIALVTSPCHQMPMALGPGSSALSVDEPGGYGVLLLSDAGPVLHDVRVGLNSAPPCEDDWSKTEDRDSLFPNQN